MKKTILIYGLAVALATIALRWLEYLYLVRVFSIEIYVSLIASFFLAMGIWVGVRFSKRKAVPQFERNEKAILYLRISDREYQVLELLADGMSNKEIAEELFVSGNTVKTHVSKLYEKLEVSRRTQAVQRARELEMIK